MAEETSLAQAMLALARDKRTGVLEARTGTARTTIYVEWGLPVYADGGVPADALGRVLVRQGLMGEEQYRTVLAKLAREDKSFGELVVELGFITHDEVETALAAQLRLKIVRCLGWEHTTHTFRPDTARVKSVPSHPTRVEPLLFLAMRLLDSERLETALAPARARFPLLRGYATAVAGRFEMGKGAVHALLFMDGTRAIEEIRAVFEADGVDAILAALLAADEVELLDTPESFFPPSPGLRRERRRAAPRRILPALPASVAALGGRPARAAAILARVRAARSAPEPSAPAAIEPRAYLGARARAYAAEHAFQAGKAHLRANRYARALPPLQQAAALAPEVSEYALYAAWTGLRLASGVAARDLARSVEEVARRALCDDATCALAHYALAHLASERGDAASARARFRHALRLDAETLKGERHVQLVHHVPAMPAPPPSLPRRVQKDASPPPRPRPTPIAPLEAKLKPRRRLDATAQSEPVPIPAGVPVEARSTPRSDPPCLEQDAEVFPGQQSQPPPAPASLPPSSARPTWTGRAAALGILVGAGVFGAVLGRASITLSPTAATATPERTPTPTLNPTPTLTPTLNPTPPATPEHSEPPDATPLTLTPTLNPTPPATPEYSEAPDATPPPPESTMGTILPPPAARWHRIFVDGRQMGEGTGPIVVPCGQRIVRIGSAGKDQTVDVPCGGELSLE